MSTKLFELAKSPHNEHLQAKNWSLILTANLLSRVVW